MESHLTDFTFYPFQDSPDNDIESGSLGLSIAALKSQCIKSLKCVGFHSSGRLKHAIYQDDELVLTKRFSKYFYYPCQDIVGSDIIQVPGRSVPELKVLWAEVPRCLEFNPLGWMKDPVVPEDIVDSLDTFDFYPGKDSLGSVRIYCPNRSIDELKRLVLNNPKLVAFTTQGALKYQLQPLNKFHRVAPDQGIYVKRSYIKVKFIGNGSNPQHLGPWNNIVMAQDPGQSPDFYVLMNKSDGESYDPSRTIVLGMEAWEESFQKDTFLQVRSHDKYCNPATYQLGYTYRQLKELTIRKTKSFSTICSDMESADFLRYLESTGDLVVQPVIYPGKLPARDRSDGYFPYKYYFMSETSNTYITQKLWEPIISECLVFYPGTYNLSEYIDPRCFIPVDVTDFPRAYQTIKQAIENGAWEKRINTIRAEKHKILDYYGIMPTIERALFEDLKFDPKQRIFTDRQVEYHKYFHDYLEAKIVCFRGVVDVGYYDNRISLQRVVYYDVDVRLGGSKLQYLVNLFVEYSSADYVFYLTTCLKVDNIRCNEYFLEAYKIQLAYYDTVKIAKGLLLVGDKLSFQPDKCLDFHAKHLSGPAPLPLRVKCINLKPREDRKLIMLKKFTEVDLMDSCDFFDGVDGTKLSPGPIQEIDFTGNCFGSKKSVMGRGLSHYKLWKHLVQDNEYDKYLILEDDVELACDFKNKLIYTLDITSKEPYDLLVLGKLIPIGWNEKPANKKLVCRKFGPSNDTTDDDGCLGSMHAYIITKLGARRIISYIDQSKVTVPIDTLILNNLTTLNVMEISPLIVTADYWCEENHVGTKIPTY
jgi:GR25 family glycosyltransferase involved in LPS biosynthesis